MDLTENVNTPTPPKLETQRLFKPVLPGALIWRNIPNNEFKKKNLEFLFLFSELDTTIEYDQKDVTEYESDTEPIDDKNQEIQGPPRIQINDVTQKESMNSTIVISKNDANESVSIFFSWNRFSVSV